MQTEIQLTSAVPADRNRQTPMPGLTMFMQRHRLSEETAIRVLKIAHNIDKADAIAELMR